MDVANIKKASSLLNELEMLEKSQFKVGGITLLALLEDGYMDYLTKEQKEGIADTIKVNMTAKVEELKAQIEAL